MPICQQRDPSWLEAAPGHFVACFLYGGAETETGRQN
jgi:hypothetical protein